MKIKFLKYNLISCFALFIYSINGYSQNLTIEYWYHPTEYFTDSFIFPLHKPNNESLPDKEVYFKSISQKFSKENGYSKSTFSYKIKDTTTAILGDLFGHQVFLLPITDTLKIIFGDKIGEGSFYSKDSFFMPWAIRFKYESKYQDIYQLYDSLDLVAGSPRFDLVNSKILDTCLECFFKKCTNKYNQRLNFVDNYCRNHGISNSIKKIVNQEIKSAYTINLLQIFQNPNTRDLHDSEIPGAYLDSINSFDYTDTKVFHKSILYPSAIYRFSLLYLNRENGMRINGKVNTYNTLKQKLELGIKDFMLSRYLNFYTKDSSNIVDSLLKDYKVFSKDEGSVKYLDSTRSLFFGSKEMQLSKIFSSLVEDKYGKLLSFDSIFSNKPILIDCWASWCKPCLSEIPYSKQFIKKYKNKVQFIFISFDSNKAAWKEMSNNLNLENSYLLPNSFDNLFSYYFNISSIPRYIIFDKKRYVKYVDAPRPSNQKELTQILNNLN